MHVVKYWRNMKLRYRLIRKIERSESKRVALEAKPRDELSREHQVDVMRAKVRT